VLSKSGGHWASPNARGNSQDTWRRGGALLPCMVDMSTTHVILPNRWRATVWSVWDALLGQIWAEFGHGPKNKVEAHELLYNFY
jgi:hypothetical protein